MTTAGKESQLLLLQVLVTQLWQVAERVVCVSRKLAQVSSVDEQGKDKDVTFAQRSEADEVRMIL